MQRFLTNMVMLFFVASKALASGNQSHQRLRRAPMRPRIVSVRLLLPLIVCFLGAACTTQQIAKPPRATAPPPGSPVNRTVDVYYATDRARVTTSTLYSDDRAENPRVQYGVCRVHIAPDQRLLARLSRAIGISH